MNFTNDQEKAYKAIGTNYLISAGAGSGKTQVLSERVRYLVQEKGYHINEFLILTFTRLAAEEMKERIRKKLIEISSIEAENVDNANICTFDSYALSIVKKYHYLLNLSKNIKMLNESVITIKIKNEIDRLLDIYYENKDQTLINFVNLYCFKDDSCLKDIIYKVYSACINSIDENKFLLELEQKNSEKFLQQFLIDYTNELDTLFNNFVDLAQVCEDKNFVNKFPIIVDAYNSSSSLDERINVLRNSKFPNIKNVDSEIKSQIDYAKKLYKSHIENFNSTEEFLSNGRKNLIFTKWIIEFVKKLLKFDANYKKENEAYVFSDIAKFAIKILKENPNIANEIRTSLKTIMIDEYQDTSLIQEEFISLISNNNVYMVGDVKQSIYRFRKATPEIFIEKFINYQKHQNGELVSLHENFRSRKEVLDDVNNIFSTIMTLELGGADYKNHHMIKSGNKCYLLASEEKQNQKTEFYYYEPSFDIFEQEARIIAEDIINKMNSNYMVWNGNMKNPKLRKVELRDFCILCDRGTNFYKFEKVFKEYKIPLHVQDNVDISSNQIVLAIASLLKLIHYIKLNDYSSSEVKHAFCSVSRSFIFKISDSEIYTYITQGIEHSDLIKKLLNYTKLNKNLSPYQFIYNLIFELNIYDKMNTIGDIKINEKYLDNFLKTLSDLRDLNFTYEDYLDYFKQINELELKLDVTSSSSDFDAVKLMNIFKSKGLEFPVVYCANLTKKFNTNELKQEFYLSSKYGIIYPNPQLTKSIIFDKNKKEEALEDISEKIRLLYVAITRAKEKVICLLPNNNTKIKSLDNISSLGDLLYFIIHKYEPKTIEELNNIPYELIENKVEQIKLKYEDLTILPIEKKKTERASKDLTFSSNIELLQFGEKLHFLLEYIDFINPDFSSIEDKKEKQLIQNFLNSNLIKNLKNPEIYKEYEFISDDTHGIIDCLIVDNNKALIIDYKLKNIDDDNYYKQLKVYYDYVKTHFNLEVECYLYSILLGKYEKISF